MIVVVATYNKVEAREKNMAKYWKSNNSEANIELFIQSY